MLKGANLKGGRRPSTPYWPAATAHNIARPFMNTLQDFSVTPWYMSAHKYSYRITDAMLVAMHAEGCLLDESTAQ